MTLITTNAALKDFCAQLQNSPYITVDTEFMREKTYYAKLCLIQVSGADKNAAAIDVLSTEEELDLTPLWNIIKDERILKVFHAARQDIEIIYTLSGGVPAPLFDSQIAAMVCGYGDQVGYEALVNDICKLKVDKTSQFTDWSRRPLSPKQITYALGDVIHLVDIYESLHKRLEKKGRSHWVLEETSKLLDKRLYEAPPEEAWMRLKLRSPKPRDLAVLKELAAWREIEAQRKDVPRSRIIKDETLLDLTYQKPSSEAELSGIRGISGEMAKSKFGKAVLAAIERGKAIPDSECPQVNITPPLHQKYVPVVEMLKMLLRITSSENDVAARLIASSDDLESFVKEPEADSPLNSGWRHDVFGQEAHELLEGRMALTLDKGKIRKIRL
ncbi:MAG: ribonuclease D [Pseudobdellovibrionaceae bacterium]